MFLRNNIFLPLCFTLAFDTSFCQGFWTQKTNFGGSPRYASVGFSIGTKGYIGTGAAHWLGPFYNDFWEWDQATNVWTQKANYGGIAKGAAIGFSIGNKGYIGTGSTQLNPSCACYSDFWEYDPATNVWTQKANFSGTARSFSVGFSIGTKGYIGTGYDGGNTNDFWEWDQAINAWTQKSNFGGAIRCVAFGYSVGTKGYIGTGWNSGQHYNDFWEWDQVTNTWTQKANFTNTLRAECVGFTIGNFLYVGTGTTNVGTGPCMTDFWQYNPSANVWTQMTSFAGGGREEAVGFSIGCHGYIGTGWVNDIPSSIKNDFWEFTPPGSGTITATAASSASTICSGQSATLTAGGGIYYSWSNGSTLNPIIVSPIVNTNYSVVVSDACGSDTAFVNITVSPLPVPTISGNTSICLGDAATLTASGGTSYQWSTGAFSASVIVSPSSATSYTVTITNSNGCTAANSATVNVIGCAPPVSTFNAASNSVCMGKCVLFSDMSSDFPSFWSWNFQGGNPSSSSQQNPTVCYDSAGVYNVSLTVSNSNGSDSTFQINYINVNDCYCPEIYLPNAFSPNGDNENDILITQGTKCVKTFSLIIYNRWGEKVFETTDILKGWDGQYNNKPENTAVFTYYLNAEFISGKLVEKKGNISLVR